MSTDRDPDSQRARTAFHEAGHVCVARVLRIGVGGVSIVPDEHSYGRWTNHPTAPLDVDGARGRDRAQRLFGVGYAGVLAEQRAVELWRGRFADFLPRSSTAICSSSWTRAGR